MGLFDFLGGKTNQGPQSKEAYFLSEDEAKTFGDIDFMRKEVVVRRTFAKKKGQEEELESVKSISSSTSKAVGEAVKPATARFTPTFAAPTPVASTPTPAPAAPTPAPAAPASTLEATSSAAPAPEVPSQEVVRQEPDAGMDMFRNMAKKMRR